MYRTGKESVCLSPPFAMPVGALEEYQVATATPNVIPIKKDPAWKTFLDEKSIILREPQEGSILTTDTIGRQK